MRSLLPKALLCVVLGAWLVLRPSDGAAAQRCQDYIQCGVDDCSEPWFQCGTMQTCPVIYAGCSHPEYCGGSGGNLICLYN